MVPSDPSATVYKSQCPGNETERQIPKDAQDLLLANSVQADSNLHRRASSKSLSSKIKKKKKKWVRGQNFCLVCQYHVKVKLK